MRSAAARAVPGVEAATSGTWATNGGGIASGLVIDGHLVGAQVFGDEGPIQPAIQKGRSPEREGEVALGPKTLASLGLRVGDDVSLSLDDGRPSIAGRVVGETVLVSPYFFDFPPGTGAATVQSTFSALGAERDPSWNVVLVRYAAGANSLRTFNAVQEALYSPGRPSRPLTATASRVSAASGSCRSSSCSVCSGSSPPRSPMSSWCR